jgi:hypothetical protein
MRAQHAVTQYVVLYSHTLSVAEGGGVQPSGGGLGSLFAEGRQVCAFRVKYTAQCHTECDCSQAYAGSVWGGLSLAT